MNLNELTIENIGTWPFAARAMTIGFICLILFGLFFVFTLKPMRIKIHQANLSEKELRHTYAIKYSQVANKEAYAAQVTEMEIKINRILGQLPEQLNVPELIGDIAKAGTEAGLTFNYIKPQPQQNYQHYSTLPIDISINGTYEQLTNYITQLAKIPRIVTINSFSINHADPTHANDISSLQNSILNMTLTAVTYKQTPPPKKENNT